MPLKFGYGAPRWSAEILDCSMPMTFDTYNSCSYNCMYCFAFFQKAHNGMKGYQTDNIKSVNPEKVARLFKNIMVGNYSALTEPEKQFIPYISQKKVMQWGAMADQFDLYEKKYGVTLALLQFFDIIDYPLSFSTKAAWWTKDKRYMDIFARHPHNWHVKISIITADKKKAAIIEKGCETPKERIEALKRLSDIGINTTLRLRPYLIGASDDYPELIRDAALAGVKSVTTEFFCMEARADEQTKARYKEMSRVLGFDLWSFYMKNSKQHGYKRLSKELKFPIMANMKSLSNSLGLRFNVSDAHGRELNDFVNCCGVPPEWNSCRAHFGGAIAIAKQKGHVLFSDIAEDIFSMFNFSWVRAVGFNTSGSAARSKFSRTKMSEWIRYCWNSVDSGNSPAKMYSCLIPIGKDKNGDIIYKYEGK